MMVAAALLPLAVVAGTVVAITQGVWPSGLIPTVAIVGVLGVVTLALVDRLLARARA